MIFLEHNIVFVAIFLESTIRHPCCKIVAKSVYQISKKILGGITLNHKLYKKNSNTLVIVLLSGKNVKWLEMGKIANTQIFSLRNLYYNR